jgi:hypothetical protein
MVNLKITNPRVMVSTKEKNRHMKEVGKMEKCMDQDVVNGLIQEIK